MHLSPSLNERFGRIASVAQGARTDGWQKLLPLAVSALLVILLAWQLVQLTWTLLGARNGVAATSSTGPAVVAPPAARAVDLSTLVNAHLFGEANAPAAGSTDP